MQHPKNLVSIIPLLFILFSSTICASATMQFDKTVSTIGLVNYWPRTTLVGISSRPTTDGSDTNYQTSVVQQVIDFMKDKGLNVYRMCFAITADPTIYVQYFFDHCNHTLILNYFHNGFATAMTDDEWNTSKTKALSLLATFSAYQDRLWLEPCNERTNSNLPTQIQSFITTIRNAGYTCNIIVDRWYSQPYSNYAAIIDPLNKFWTGEHHYFNKEGNPNDPPGETLSWAETKEQQGLALNLKMLDTEVGADTLEYPQFQKVEVDAVSSYLQLCRQNNVGACGWMLHGIRNWATTSSTSYKNLGLIFPSPNGN